MIRKIADMMRFMASSVAELNNAKYLLGNERQELRSSGGSSNASAAAAARSSMSLWDADMTSSNRQTTTVTFFFGQRVLSKDKMQWLILAAARRQMPACGKGHWYARVEGQGDGCRGRRGVGGVVVVVVGGGGWEG